MTQLVQEPIASFGFELLDDLSRGVTLQIGEHARQIRRGDNGVKVGIENDPGMELERLVLTTVLERVHQDIAARRGSEDGKPGDCGAGYEVGEIAFENAVAAAHGER